MKEVASYLPLRSQVLPNLVAGNRSSIDSLHGGQWGAREGCWLFFCQGRLLNGWILAPVIFPIVFFRLAARSSAVTLKPGMAAECLLANPSIVEAPPTSVRAPSCQSAE